jgi:hypothetical protein
MSEYVCLFACVCVYRLYFRSKPVAIGFFFPCSQSIIAEVKSRGAVLLRGLPLKTAEDFWGFLQRFPGLGYGSFRGGGGPRTAVIGPVHYSTFTPKHLEIVGAGSAGGFLQYFLDTILHAHRAHIIPAIPPRAGISQ